jgi:Kelch motif/Galactose oxidase, central domain
MTGAFSGYANYGASPISGTISAWLNDGTNNGTLAGSGAGISFANMSQTSYATAAYGGEDVQVILGKGNYGASTNNLQIAFATMPDKYNYLDHTWSFLDDYSAWGYMSAATTDATTTMSGWWVAGMQTPSATITALGQANKSYVYNGHIAGDVFVGSVLTPIRLDSYNHLDMRVNFGQANPITLTALSFKTADYQYQANVVLSDIGSWITTGNAIGTAYGATFTNGTNHFSITNGKFYGPNAESTGGQWSGSFPDYDVTSGQGVFKASNDAASSAIASAVSSIANDPAGSTDTGSGDYSTLSTAWADVANDTTIGQALNGPTWVGGNYLYGAMYGAPQVARQTIVDYAANGMTGHYEGKIAGYVSDGYSVRDAIKGDSTTNQLAINVNFGAANPVSASAKFTTVGGWNWNFPTMTGGFLPSGALNMPMQAIYQYQTADGTVSNGVIGANGTTTYATNLRLELNGAFYSNNRIIGKVYGEVNRGVDGSFYANGLFATKLTSSEGTLASTGNPDYLSGTYGYVSQPMINNAISTSSYSTLLDYMNDSNPTLQAGVSKAVMAAYATDSTFASLSTALATGSGAEYTVARNALTYLVSNTMNNPQSTTAEADFATISNIYASYPTFAPGNYDHAIHSAMYDIVSSVSNVGQEIRQTIADYSANNVIGHYTGKIAGYVWDGTARDAITTSSVLINVAFGKANPVSASATFATLNGWSWGFPTQIANNPFSDYYGSAPHVSINLINGSATKLSDTHTDGILALNGYFYQNGLLMGTMSGSANSGDVSANGIFSTKMASTDIPATGFTVNNPDYLNSVFIYVTPAMINGAIANKDFVTLSGYLSDPWPSNIPSLTSTAMNDALSTAITNKDFTTVAAFARWSETPFSATAQTAIYSILNSVNANYYDVQPTGMQYSRVGLGATKLLDGRVFVAGGFNYDQIDHQWVPSQIYDPSTGLWTTPAVINVPTNGWTSRMGLGVTTLGTTVANQKVLIVGGNDGWGWNMEYVDLYNVSTNTWTPQTSLPVSRSGLALVTLQNGKALAIGGSDTTHTLDSVLLFDPATNNGFGSWTSVASMSTARSGMGAVTLQDGKVLVMGGYTTWPTSLSSVEMFDPTTNNGLGSWTPKNSMLSPRGGLSSVLLANGNVLAIGGAIPNGSGNITQLNTVEQYDVANNSWQYKVPLPFTFDGGAAVTLNSGSVLIIGGHQDGSTSANSWIYNPAHSLANGAAILPTTYDAGVNNGYFIGSTSNMSSQLFGNINSMLFHHDLSTVSTLSGQLHGSLGTLAGFNSAATGFDFGHFIGATTPMASYAGEDNKIIWGNAIINSKNATIGFASLPDKIDATTGVLSSVDDYSSWGYWEAMSTDSSEYYNGYWVSGQPTPASYIQDLMTAHTSVNYSGHVLGDTFNGAAKDGIVLNSANKINMTVNFGLANPINVTALSFQTSQGWNYNQSTNLTNTASAIAVNTTANTQSYTATVGNSANTDALNLQGKFYGTAAQSTGGAFAGNLTGTKNAVDSARAVQGVFKARQ